MALLSPTKQIPGRYLEQAMTTIFLVLSSSLLTNDPTTWHCIVQDTDSIVNNTHPSNPCCTMDTIYTLQPTGSNVNTAI
jgi:hypothetical protein